MRSLTPVEAALAFALGGSALAVMLPTFFRNLHASRMVEALDGLEHIAARATALAEMAPQASAYPDSAPLTPANVPRAQLVADPPGAWNHPTWRLLNVTFDTPHAFAFQFDSVNSENVSSFTATAHGDLDGDGVLSTFQTSGSIRRGQPAERKLLEVIREVE